MLIPMPMEVKPRPGKAYVISVGVNRCSYRKFRRRPMARRWIVRKPFPQEVCSEKREAVLPKTPMVPSRQTPPGEGVGSDDAEPWSGGATFVLVMQPADMRDLNDRAGGRRPRYRRVLVKGRGVSAVRDRTRQRNTHNPPPKR